MDEGRSWEKVESFALTENHYKITVGIYKSIYREDVTDFL